MSNHRTNGTGENQSTRSRLTAQARKISWLIARVNEQQKQIAAHEETINLQRETPNYFYARFHEMSEKLDHRTYFRDPEVPC